jgi:hypothetical protein
MTVLFHQTMRAVVGRTKVAISRHFPSLLIQRAFPDYDESEPQSIADSNETSHPLQRPFVVNDRHSRINRSKAQKLPSLPSSSSPDYHSAE